MDIRAWDFVEEYYPNYHGSDEIAENDSLQKIVDGEIEDSAETLFRDIAGQLALGIGFESIEDMEETEYQEVVTESEVRLQCSNALIYERSIEEYLTILPKIDAERQELIDCLTKMCEFHEKNASWDKGDNGYYKSKRLLEKLNKV